ncbi:MAG: hypothetical protein U0939_22445 [Pirellulales bacterium]
MYDLIDEEIFTEAVGEQFPMLEQLFVETQCRDLLPRLQATYDQMFETSFVIVDRETHKPLNVNAVLKKRDAADEFLKIVGEDKYEVAILLTDR